MEKSDEGRKEGEGKGEGTHYSSSPNYSFKVPSVTQLNEP